MFVPLSWGCNAIVLALESKVQSLLRALEHPEILSDAPQDSMHVPADSLKHHLGLWRTVEIANFGTVDSDILCFGVKKDTAWVWLLSDTFLQICSLLHEICWYASVVWGQTSSGIWWLYPTFQKGSWKVTKRVSCSLHFVSCWARGNSRNSNYRIKYLKIILLQFSE